MLRTLRFSSSVQQQSCSFIGGAIRQKSDYLAKKRILVTGANGQIGSDLIGKLRETYGQHHVVATDISEPPANRLQAPFRLLNVVDRTSIEKVVLAEDIGTIIHLAAVMSVKGEARPHLCMELGIDSVEHMLEVSRTNKCRLYIPSSIAAFSPESGKDINADEVHQNPTTIYGITKVFAEKLGTYYNKKFDVDFRCLRYPGIISHGTKPGGGTTDYAVWCYHYALQKKKYFCPINEKAFLPMMYMPDCLGSTITMLEAPKENLSKCVYNISSMSFNPELVTASIRKFIPDFEIDYSRIDPVPEAIAKSWPGSMNDSAARKDLRWEPTYDLDKMTEDMLKNIEKQYATEGKFPLP
jgi:nucleoside-diphosphate-sugar epimerase